MRLIVRRDGPGHADGILMSIPTKTTPECEQVERQLVAYLKGGLSPVNEATIRSHLRRCRACAALAQDAQALDRELRVAAYQEQREITPAASARIQAQLYRRMRRALFWRRGRNLGFALAMLLLVAGALFAGDPWSRYLASLATPAPAPTAVVEAEPTLAEGLEIAAEMPGPPADEGAVLPAAVEDGQEALAVVRQAVAAAIGGDEAALARLTADMQSAGPAGPRVWRRLRPCQGTVSADQIRYRLVSHSQRFAAVHLSYAGRFVGEMKLGLDNQGEWRLVYLNYASFSALGPFCRPAAGG
jgi:hypothetical protein